MRAVYLDGFGTSPHLGDQPEPKPRAGQVVVRVEQASLNSADVKLAFGWFPEAPNQPYPITLGRDLAGTVIARGQSSEMLPVGQQVFGFVPDRPLHHGSFADITVVDETALIAVPPGLDMTVAACLPAAGTTALAAVSAAGVAPGDRVLMIGASGGVGSIAVQLAVAAGATVDAPGYPADVEHLSRVGVARILDRDHMPAESAYDCLIDLVGTGETFESRLALVRTGGRAVSSLHAGTNSPVAAARSITVAAANGVSNPDLLRVLAEHVLKGTVTVPITRVVGLAEVPAALDEFRRGHTVGKTAVAVE